MHKRLVMFSLVTLLSIASNTLFAKTKDIYSRQLNQNDGLSQPTASSIYQDERGAMWIGTRDGLNLYNGNNSTVFRHDSKVPSSIFGNNIEKVVGDKMGHLYLKCKFGLIEFDIATYKARTIVYKDVYTLSYDNNQLWVASANAIYKLSDDREKLVYITSIPEDANDIFAIKETTDKRLYIGTKEVGNKKSGLFLSTNGKKPRLIIPNIGVYSLFEDSRGDMWVAAREYGLYRIEKNGKITQFLHTDSNKLHVRNIIEDNNGSYWVGTLSGLIKFYPENGKYDNIRNAENLNTTINNNAIISLFKDKNGSIWCGSYYNGIRVFNPNIEIFSYIKSSNALNRVDLSSSIIGKPAKGDKGLWIPTEGGGLNFYDFATKEISYIQVGDKNSTLHSNTIKSLHLDTITNNLWIGTIFGGLSKYNTHTKVMHTYFSDTLPSSLHNNSIRKIVQYGDTLFLATHKGVSIMNTKTSTFEQLSCSTYSSVKERQAYDIYFDSSNKELWIAQSTGIYCYNISNEKFTHYSNQRIFREYYNNNIPTHLFVSADNTFYIGTNGNGVIKFDKESQQFTDVRLKNLDITNEYIVAINETKTGQLLLATNNGFYRIDTKTATGKLFNKENGYPFQNIHDHSLYVNMADKIYVGTENGLISFENTDLKGTSQDYIINITELEINNKMVAPLDNSEILEKSLYFQEKITLKHQHKSIAVEYSTTNYTHQLNDEVTYYLDGFDKEWNQAKERQKITYTNLKAGNYKLHIKSTRQDASGDYPEKVLSITIKPPYYQTWWAYTIYVIAIISLMIYFILLYASRIKLRSSLMMEKREKERENEHNQSKQRFFINVSHELRTPLTLLSGELQQVLEIEGQRSRVYNRLVHVQRHADRMTRLIDELLEFRKFEMGHARPKVSPQNIVAYLQEVYLSFNDYAVFKKINYTFACADEEIELYFDRKQLARVFYNILSNAFKYTPENGSITIEILSDQSQVYISVSDTGAGMSKEVCDKVFERFYNFQEQHDVKGTGIGLSYAKSIIDAHNGTIKVDSSEGEGSTFTIELIKGNKHFTDVEFVAYTDNDQRCIETVVIPEDNFTTTLLGQRKDETLPKLLIVEDNIEIQQLLVQIFGNLYEVKLANDGEEGVEVAAEYQPDLILSDIMMPRKSGIELCQTLKNDIATCHIPIVLLTAKMASEFAIEGLETGADDYISKPFNAKELVLRCNNIINSRKNLQLKTRTEPDPNIVSLTKNSLDKEFISSVLSMIENNIASADLNIDFLCKNAGMGRTLFFNKIKAITGHTPSEFITRQRIKKSRTLLEQTQQDIAEIAYSVGFTTPSYFIKIFKKMTDETPSAYRKQRLNK